VNGDGGDDVDIGDDGGGVVVVVMMMVVVVAVVVVVVSTFALVTRLRAFLELVCACEW